MNQRSKSFSASLNDFKNPLLVDSFMDSTFTTIPKIIISKIGFRFVFQSGKKTLTDTEVDKVMGDIVKSTLSLMGLKYQGLIMKLKKKILTIFFCSSFLFQQQFDPRISC